MHERVLPGSTKSVLARLSALGIVTDAYLAGGTAAALQLGHRISYDLDFFTPEKFDEQKMFDRLAEQGFQSDFEDWQTLNGTINDVKFSYFYYPYPLLFGTLRYEGAAIASLQDVAIMKVDAIGRREKKRDFIDLFCIIKNLGCTMFDLFAWYSRKFEPQKNTLVHAVHSLTYFAEAEKDDTPLELLQPIVWEEIKKFFVAEIGAYARSVLGDPREG